MKKPKRLKIIKYKPKMNLKTNEHGELILNLKLAKRSVRRRKQPSLFDELAMLEKEAEAESTPSPEGKISEAVRQSQILRKLLRYCMKNQNIGIGDIAEAVYISKNKIINFLKNRNTNPLRESDLKNLRIFLQKQMVF